MPIPFLELDQSLSPVTLAGAVCAAITNAFIMQTEQMLEEMKDLYHQQDCVVQEADKAQKVGKDV